MYNFEATTDKKKHVADGYITPRQNGAGTYINPDGSTIKVDISTTPVNLPDYANIVGILGPRRVSGVEFFIGMQGVEDNRTDEQKKEDEKYINQYINKPDNYQTYYKGKDGIIFIPITLTPAVFRADAAAYKEDQDRKAWLTAQITKLLKSGEQYGTALADLQQRAANFDGKSDVATWMQTIGGAAATTGNPYAIGGGVVLVATGFIVNYFKGRSDKKAVEPYLIRAQKLQAEATEIKAFYDAYTEELSSQGTGAVLAILGAAAAFTLFPMKKKR